VVLALTLMIAGQPVVEQESAASKHQEITYQSPAPPIEPVARPTPTIEETKTNDNPQDWKDWFWPPIWSNWILAAVAIGGICVAIKSLKIIERQTAATEKAAEAALSNAKALINSERAWIDGEIIKLQIIEHTFYSLKMTNHGKTPAQIFNYEISHGLLNKGVEFPDQKLSTQITANDYVFLASGDTKTLWEEFDMDELFTTSETMATGAFSVTIKYGDVVSEEEGRQEWHETSFVYYYNTFMSSLERISTYNKYT
jgi:hypothetical protein